MPPVQVDTPADPNSGLFGKRPPTFREYGNQSGATIPKGSIVAKDYTNDTTAFRSIIVAPAAYATPKTIGILDGSGSDLASGTGALGAVVTSGPVKALVQGIDDTGAGAAISVGDPLTSGTAGQLVKATTGAGLGLRSDRGIVAFAAAAVQSGAAAALVYVDACLPEAP